MKTIVPVVILLLFSSGISGCLEESRGPDSHIDESHIYIRENGVHTTLCEQSIVLMGGEAYTCTFTTTRDLHVIIYVDISSDSDPIDLITMDDMNYQKWQDGEGYYSIESHTDLGTSGGNYGEDTALPDGDWNVVFHNVPG